MAGVWPDWLISKENAAELARYVNDSRARSWVPSDCIGRWEGIGEGRARAKSLYGALLDRRIVYANEPWNPARSGVHGELAYQRVRSPDETMQGPATCLDLAVVFAGMAMAADMRPLVGLRSGPRPHALVVLDIRSSLSAVAQAGSGGVPSGFTQRSDTPGLWDRGPAEMVDGGASLRDGRWVIMDVSQAARRFWQEEGASFDDATEQGASLARWRGQTWTLVDVGRVQEHLSPYDPPTGRSVPAIHGYLPALPAFTAYPSRKKLLDGLRDLVGTRRFVTADRDSSVEDRQPAPVIVLQGPSGFGKSMLAHRLAIAADHGCGWFLNATDDKVLTRSLAQAERQEKGLRDAGSGAGRSGEKPDQGEDRALAASALDRLRDADRPWVVVLDNCDADPATAPGLQALLPMPRRSAGQVLIITTRHPNWAPFAHERGWQQIELPALGAEDLSSLGLPPGLGDAVDGRPLIAQALAALGSVGEADLPERADLDGPALVWDLVRASQAGSPDAIGLARLLAWCPPEPMNVAALELAAGIQRGSRSGEMLTRLRFVTGFMSEASPVNSDAGPGEPETGDAIQMHRLFAAAVRGQVRRDDPAAAAEVVDRLVTSEAGRWLFIDAADDTALDRLERGAEEEKPGEVETASMLLADRSRPGLLWYGLGHVRERRGPVSMSGPHFAQAVQDLDRDKYPFEVAESLIGQARVVFQNSQATTEQLAEARATAEEGRRLLAPLATADDTEARQLREQGNALSWLIAQNIAWRTLDPRAREAELARVRENLWLSYEQRLRIARGLPDGAKVSRDEPPLPRDGLGAERAYYNLGGVNILLARTHHELADVHRIATQAPGPDHQPGILPEAQDLRQAEMVYEAVRALREQRYRGRAHPHLASCLHGQAVVAYYRAALLGETAQLGDAFGFAAAAMEQRRKVAVGLAGHERAILRDTDMRKSVDFMMKVAISATFARFDSAAQGEEAAAAVFDETKAEWLGRPPAHGTG